MEFEKCNSRGEFGRAAYREELLAFGEDLLGTVELVGSVRHLIIDHAKATFADGSACLTLCQVKDECLAGPVGQIISVVADEGQVEAFSAQRLQAILEGREVVQHEYPAATAACGYQQDAAA